MLDIKSFLGKFKKIYSDRKLSEEIVIKTIKKISGVSLKEENLDFNSSNVYIKSKPTTRAQIFIYKQKIEESLHDDGIHVNIR